MPHTKTVSGVSFTILTEDELEAKRSKCKHQWTPDLVFEVVNPNGEYIEGYGTSRVSVSVPKGERCLLCGATRSAS